MYSVLLHETIVKRRLNLYRSTFVVVVGCVSFSLIMLGSGKLLFCWILPPVLVKVCSLELESMYSMDYETKLIRYKDWRSADINREKASMHATFNFKNLSLVIKFSILTYRKSSFQKDQDIKYSRTFHFKVE